MAFRNKIRFVWLPAVVLLAVTLTASTSPASFEDEFRKGLLALQNNQLTEARECLLRASRLEPGNARVWVALAQAYLRNKDKGHATGAALHAETIAANDPVIQHALAIFFSETGDLRKAADLERRYAGSKSADSYAAARAATFSLQAGEPQQAITWARAALGKGESAEMHHLLGIAEEAAGQPDVALTDLRKAVDLAPYDEDLTFDLGQALLRRRDFAAALTFLSQARERFSKSAQIEVAYGIAAYGHRQFRDAITAFLHATELDPSLAESYICIGRIVENVDDLMPQVLSRFSAWVAAEPGNYLPWFLHAKALDSSSRDFATSETELRRSISLNPNFWESRLELGIVLVELGRWQEALPELNRAIALDPSKAKPHFQLARVYRHLGRTEDARQELAEFQKLSVSETGSLLP